MEKRLEKIRKDFGHKLVGNKHAKRIICETLLMFPNDIINLVTKNICFLASFHDAWAYTLDSRDFQNKHVIILSDQLFEQNREQIRSTIIHEIGHVILGHRNAFNAQQSREEIAKQEQDAESFTVYYINRKIYK